MLEGLADLGLSVLLIVTAVWCGLLHHRLRRLRTDRGEMEGFIAALANASERAEAAIRGLREAAVEAEARLREEGEATRQRGSELARLVESGTRLARRLEADLGHGARGLAAAAASSAGPGRLDAAPRKARPDQDARAQGDGMPEPATRAGAAGLPPGALLRALETLR